MRMSNPPPSVAHIEIPLVECDCGLDLPHT